MMLDRSYAGTQDLSAKDDDPRNKKMIIGPSVDLRSIAYYIYKDQI